MSRVITVNSIDASPIIALQILLPGQALAARVADFTGISAPYERPEQSELVIDTSVFDQPDYIAKLMDYIEETIPLLTC